MKKFIASEQNWCEDEGAKWVFDSLVFPYAYLEDRFKWSIHIYKGADEPDYGCGLYAEYNEEYAPDEVMTRRCATYEEIEAFVNECFELVKGEYTRFLVGKYVYLTREKAEQIANGNEIQEVIEYPTDEHYEFYEGEGAFKGEYD